jgi:hypothetical protein
MVFFFLGVVVVAGAINLVLTAPAGPFLYCLLDPLRSNTIPVFCGNKKLGKKVDAP